MRWRIRRRISSYILRKIASPQRRKRKRAQAEAKRQKEGRPHQIYYFHQLNDPYSHLAAQKLAAFAACFDVEILSHLVGEPPAEAMPEATMLKNYALLDAKRIAPFFDLTFSKNWQVPLAEEQSLAARFLAGNDCAHLVEVSAALWSGDKQALNALTEKGKLASAEEAEAFIDKGTSLRKALRHYLGAMFYYEGEWYWGIDRLNHLEKRLRELNIARADEGAQDITFARLDRTPSRIDVLNIDKPKLQLEYFPSLRSPYSYLSIDETLALEQNYPVEIIFRPVMPMVMRGMKVPPTKGFYIFFDTKREAEIRGVDFGKVLDPLGLPVLRGFSLFNYARAQGKAGAYLQSYFRASFAEGIDVYSKRGLKKVVECAGLDWRAAKPLLDNEDWHEELEKNREAMFSAGCWGVPSYRLLGDDKNDDFAVWGNDRLWLIKEEIARRL